MSQYDKEQHIKKLEQRIQALEKTNRILIARVEHTVDKQGNAFAMFQQALNFEKQSLENKKQYQKIQREKQAAEAASTAKSGFLAMMSHELRTPMNAIIGYSDMLHEEAEAEGSEWTEDLNKVRVAANQLLSLINDVLDYSKIEAGKMQVHPETVDIKEFINELRIIVQTLAQKHNNHLFIECDPLVSLWHTDITKLRQILLNLLSNACKFTKNGDISLRIQNQVYENKPHLSFAVTDTGIGIEKHHQEKLFQAFTQADSSTTRNYGGTGLGLALSQQLAEILQGHIQCDSEYGVGSCFTLYLPHYREPNSAQQ
ncbi:ATP-binding protein [Candidatus Albibeggiatoa sp. nov. NOAA]|uniref:sensor histidine kinase n=1 Tax=Candidatus Albibeggiatoa sp. nov. NOAA TaxID=3162724 RepID=UPI0033048F86|nr:ATP-binding protein [Thiotrichaceae bacterium]